MDFFTVIIVGIGCVVSGFLIIGYLRELFKNDKKNN